MAESFKDQPWDQMTLKYVLKAGTTFWLTPSYTETREWLSSVWIDYRMNNVSFSEIVEGIYFNLAYC